MVFATGTINTTHVGHVGALCSALNRYFYPVGMQHTHGPSGVCVVHINVGYEFPWDVYIRLRILSQNMFDL